MPLKIETHQEDSRSRVMKITGLTEPELSELNSMDYREMIEIARQLFPDIRSLMNMDGGGSAVLGMVLDGSFMELSCPSTSADSTVGMVRPVNTVLYMPVGQRRK